MKKFFYFLFFLLLILEGCARSPRPVAYHGYKSSQNLPKWLKPYTVNGKTYYPLPSSKGYEEVCIASWYGMKFHGKLTASGEVYNMYDHTAAHRTLPIGTYVLVTNLENGKQTIVRINDRGPFVKNRCIDLSYIAAKDLGMIGKGTAKVKIVALSEGELTALGIKYKNVPNFRQGRFYLQVGSFRFYSNALKLKKSLKRRFRRVEIEPFIKNGVVYYRVQIYLSNDFYKAVKLARKLKKKRFKTAFLVAK